uniref:Selenoprotein T n=1 Tax=Plectus sambesii TaxID=2011161 RepID=A0A914WG80_9BILA
MAGQNPFQMVGMQTPSAFQWALNNKISSCMLLFFLGNAIGGQLISTGAFEVSFNDQVIWSKLESGRVPQPQEIFHMIDDQIRLVGHK